MFALRGPDRAFAKCCFCRRIVSLPFLPREKRFNVPSVQFMMEGASALIRSVRRVESDSVRI